MKLIQKIAVMALSLVLMAGAGRSQKPEKVYSVVKEIHPFEWYQAQAVAWKGVIDGNPADAPAWLNYYTANRMMWLTDRGRFDKLTGPAFKTPQEIVESAAGAVPGSFEALYIRLWTHQDYPGREKDLMKAYELAKGSPEILDEMCLHYEVKGDAARRKEVNRQWLQSNDIPAGILNYNYNVLVTLPDDAIVVTGGDNDTFPLWVLQDAMDVKPAVKVVNISLMMMPAYRKRVFSALGIPDIAFTASDYPSQDSVFVKRQLILGRLLERAKQPVYIALTLDRRYYSDAKIQQDLYLDGLALRYDKKAYDNLATIRHHFENDYLLDYLRVSFRRDASTPVVEQINTGYLPALVKLCRHYRESGEQRRLDDVKRMIYGITKGSHNESEYKEYEPFLNCN